MKPICTLFFLFMLLCACGDKLQDQRVGFRIEEGKLTLPLDSETSYVSLALAYLRGSDNETGYLDYLANTVPAIHVFDLDKRQLHFSIPLHVE
jgi:hypothetical protein